MAVKDELWEKASPGLKTNPISIEAQWSLPPEDISESEIMLFASIIAFIPGKIILFSLLHGSTKRPLEVSPMMMSLNNCISPEKNRPPKIFLWCSCMMLKKCARVSYSAHRTLKLLKSVSLPGSLVFRNLNYISGLSGTGKVRQKWVKTVFMAWRKQSPETGSKKTKIRSEASMGRETQIHELVSWFQNQSERFHWDFSIRKCFLNAAQEILHGFWGKPGIICC